MKKLMIKDIIDNYKTNQISIEVLIEEFIKTIQESKEENQKIDILNNLLDFNYNSNDLLKIINKLLDSDISEGVKIQLIHLIKDKHLEPLKNLLGKKFLPRIDPHEAIGLELLEKIHGSNFQVVKDHEHIYTSTFDSVRLNPKGHIVWLYGVEWTLLELNCLIFFPHLKKLSMSASEIKNPVVIGKLINLEEIDYESSNIHSIDCFKSLTKLKFLKLSSSMISSISNLEYLRNLEGLDLSYNLLTEIKGLKGLSRLTYINLEGNHFNDMKALALELPNSIESLHLIDNHFPKIEGLDHLENLKIIELCLNDFPQELINQIGEANHAQKYIEYCKKNKE